MIPSNLPKPAQDTVSSPARGARGRCAIITKVSGLRPLGRCRRARRPSDWNRIRRLCRRGGSAMGTIASLHPFAAGSAATSEGMPAPRSGRSHFGDIAKPSPDGEGGRGSLRSRSQSILALTGGLCFLLALDAGLFVMLALANLLQDAAAGALTLEPFESALQRLVITDTNLGHCYPSSRSSRLDSRQPDGFSHLWQLSVKMDRWRTVLLL